jgi:hypothetical protein
MICDISNERTKQFVREFPDVSTRRLLEHPQNVRDLMNVFP